VAWFISRERATSNGQLKKAVKTLASKAATTTTTVSSDASDSLFAAAALIVSNALSSTAAMTLARYTVGHTPVQSAANPSSRAIV
jgi:hypothetical protein